MTAFEIQLKINKLRQQKIKLYNDISNLEQKRARIEMEYSRKIRQESQMKAFFASQSAKIISLRESIDGNMIKTVLQRYEEICGTSNSDGIAANIRSVQMFLRKNCDKIDDNINEIRIKINNIDTQIYNCNKKLVMLEDED